MRERLRVAVVGAGLTNSLDGRERWAVRGHLPALKALSELYEVVAVCTTRRETATASARHFGVPNAFDSVERMLKELPEIDVVCASVRPTVHYPVVMAALKAGKHVYCEQPLGVSTAQAQEMYECAKKKGVQTILGHQTHYEPAALQMAELVEQGYVGAPITAQYTSFVSNNIVPRPAHRQWIFQAQMGGHPGFRSGQSLERMVAVLGRDIVEICADMAVKVEKRANLDGGPPILSDQVDNLNYLLRFRDAIMGTMQVSTTAWFGTGTRFEIYGTDGMLMLTSGDSPERAKKTGRGEASLGELILAGARADVEKFMANPTPPERLQRQFERIPVADRHYFASGVERGRAQFLVAQAWHAFYGAIRAGKECAPSFRDQLKIHYVWDAAEQSVCEKRWVPVDYSRLDAAAVK